MKHYQFFRYDYYLSSLSSPSAPIEISVETRESDSVVGAIIHKQHQSESLQFVFCRQWQDNTPQDVSPPLRLRKFLLVDVSNAEPYQPKMESWSTRNSREDKEKLVLIGPVWSDEAALTMVASTNSIQYNLQHETKHRYFIFEIVDTKAP